MSTTSPGQALTLNTLATIANPTAEWGAPASAVQIQNASPFALSIVANGETYTITSFTAQTIPLPADGASVTLLPTNGPAGAQGNVVAVWLDKGESPPMVDGQLTGAATYAQGLGSTILPPTTITNSGGGSPTTTIAIPPTVRTLLVSFSLSSALNAANTLLARGLTSQYLYYFDVPYLQNSGGTVKFLCIFPVNAILDPSIALILGLATGQSATIQVIGDTAGYKESEYYNGATTPAWDALTAAGSVVLANGPCRLLTAWISNTAAGTSTEVDIDSLAVPVLRSDSVGNGGQVEWAGGIRVPAGQTVSMKVNLISSGFAFAGITTAFP